MNCALLWKEDLMKIKLKDLATARDGRICFDYTIDLQKEEVNFEQIGRAHV